MAQWMVPNCGLLDCLCAAGSWPFLAVPVLLSQAVLLLKAVVKERYPSRNLSRRLKIEAGLPADVLPESHWLSSLVAGSAFASAGITLAWKLG